MANNRALGGIGASGVGGRPGGYGGSADGGVYAYGNENSFTVLDTSFSGNEAQGGIGGNGGGQGGAAEGGGLDFLNYGSNSWTIQQSSFDANNATGGSGGQGSTGSARAGGAASGGGLYVGSGPVTLTNCSVTNNEAAGGVGGVGGPGGVGGAGAAASGGGIANVASSGSLTAINTTLGANTAQGGNAGAGGYLAGDASGGGLFEGAAAGTLINDTLAFNAAVAGSGGQSSANALGGGVYSATGSPTLTNVILESNSAATGSPDFYGMVGTASSYDFISNTSGIINASSLSSFPGMILNNTTPQLNTLTFDPFTGLSYYSLLSTSQAIGAGTQGVVNTIAAAEGVPPANATDEIGNPLVVNNFIAMGAVQPAGNGGGGGNTDTLIWNPLNGSDDSTQATNWYDQDQKDNGVAAPGPANPLIFDGTFSTTSNDPIRWKAKVTVASITLQNGYTAQMWLNPGIVVTDAGSLTEDAASTLKLDFGAKVGNQTSGFQVNNGGTITNMILAGDRTGVFDLAGGTMWIAEAVGYTDLIGVHFIVEANASLKDLGFSSLKFNNNDLELTVYGELDTYFGQGAGSTLVDNNNFTNDYIDVAGGTLDYYGKNGVKDTFTVPVWVQKGGWNQQGGTFLVTVSSGGQGAAPGGTLVVKDDSKFAFPGGQKVSVYMRDAASSVQLAYEETLECDNNYYQTDGTLEPIDTSTCTLQAGDQSQGTVTIVGGKLKIAQPDVGTYGTFNVNAANLNFAGTYYVAISTNTKDDTGKLFTDLLNVSGTTNLQKGCSLYVYVNGGKPVQGSVWAIIQDGQGNNIQGDFPKPTTNPQNTLNAGVNKNQYLLSF